MGNLPRIAVPIFLLALGSCLSSEERFERNEAAYRGDVLAMYPPGRSWAEFEDSAKSFRRWKLEDPAPNRFAALALQHARNGGFDSISSCRHGVRLRTGWGSSFGAFGVWWDYVFLDCDDRVVIAYREFVD